MRIGELLPQLDRLQHRFLVLRLVLRDVAVDGAAIEQPRFAFMHATRERVLPQAGERTHAHTVEPVRQLVERGQRQRASRGAGRDDGVERGLEPFAGEQRRIVSAERAIEPELFEGGDVAEVPGERTHDRMMLPTQIVLAERRDEFIGAQADGAEQCFQLDAQLELRVRALRVGAPLEEHEREEVVGIALDALEREAEARCGGRENLRAILAADLRAQHLAARDTEVPAEERNGDVERPCGTRVDFDTLAPLVVERHVLERIGRNAGAELAIGAREQVEREGRRVPGGVVVGRLEAQRIFHEVDADEEMIAGTQLGRDEIEEAVVLDSVEVADARAEEGEHQRRHGADERQRALVGRGDPLDVDRRIDRGEIGARSLQRRLADVDGNVVRAARAGVGKGGQQAPRLGGAAGAELDDRRGADLPT